MMSISSKKDLFFVGVQMLLLIAYLFEIPGLRIDFPEEIDFLHLIFAGIGVVMILISMLQLNKDLSPFPTPKKGAKLVTRGIFAYVRHPIYSGLLIATFFLAYYLDSGYKLIIFSLLAILFYYKSKFEEEQLLERFPGYIDYKKRTGRFLPKF